MRRVFMLCATIIVILASIRFAEAEPTSSLDLRADRVVYYGNRYIVWGEGHVRVRLSDGTVLTGELFSMDLKLNRFLLAGDVHIDSATVHEVGAAFAGYPDLDRSFFLSAHGNPDKWTYFGLDFEHPNKGRAQPGDAYFIPDITNEKPYIVASTALILPNTNVKFTSSRLYVLGVFVPTGSWVQTFSANPNYSQNAFSGASFDIGLPYQGTARAVSSLHLRYTGFNKFFLSFDQHFVWGRDYVVFSINPLTNIEKQYNLIGYKRISPKMEARIFAQLSAAQHGIYQPEVASSFTNLSYVFSARHSAFTLNADQYNTSLLQYPAYSSLSDERAYDHPADAQIAWTGRDTPLTKFTPINLRLRSGVSVAHDGYHCGKAISWCLGDPHNTTGEDIGFVLDYFGAGRTRVPTIWSHFVGATLYTSSIPLDKLHSLNFNLTLDKQRQWFSLPHFIDTTSTTASISKTYTRKLAFLGAFSVAQLGDFYGARQLEFYPPFIPVGLDGHQYTGFQAFRGFETLRTITGSAVVTPNEYFNYVFTVRRAHNFPGPEQGAFAYPTWQMTNEVRFRLARQILMDISRTDYFHFNGYQPSFNVQFGP